MNKISMVSEDNLNWLRQQAELKNMPLVADNENNPQLRDVTFIWRSASFPAGVYLFLNRVTDKDLVAKGMMTQIASSELWTLTLQLPASYRGTYTFTEIPANTPEEHIARIGGRNTAFIGRADPLNLKARINVRGNPESVLALDLAPPQPEWLYAAAAPRGKLLTSNEQLAGQTRRIRLYLPDAPPSTPLGLLVLPDAESWIDYVGLPGALDAAMDSGRIAPFAVLGIDNCDLRDRTEILGGDRRLVDEVAERIIPAINAAHPDRRWAGRTRTVLGGQSLGGVTALMAAIHAPQTFGAAISSSPSLWWTPDGGRRPADFSAQDSSWVSETVLAHAPTAAKICLNIGTLEGAMVPHVDQLHQRLRNAGVESTLTHYTGGHDYAWWRGAIIDSLATL